MGLAEVLYRICMRNENLRDKCIIALTNIYEKLGRPREALDLLMRSDWTESYLLTYQLAYFRSEIGEIEVAIKMFEDLLAQTDFQKGEVDSDLIATLIQLYVRQKDYDKALNLLARFENNIKDQPKSGMVWFNSANALIAKGEFEKAIQYNKKALHSIEGMDQNVLHNIAHCYLSMKKYDDAIIYFAEALQNAIERSDLGRIYFGMGCTCRGKGETAKAKTHFRMAIDNGFAKAEDALRELV